MLFTQEIVIYLNKPGFEVGIEQHIVAVHFEAVLVIDYDALFATH